MAHFENFIFQQKLVLVWQVLLFKLKKQTSKNVADTTFKAMNWNLLNVFRFTELEKKLGFFLEVRYNSKITQIKTKAVVNCHGNNSGNHVYCRKKLT